MASKPKSFLFGFGTIFEWDILKKIFELGSQSLLGYKT